MSSNKYITLAILFFSGSDSPAMFRSLRVSIGKGEPAGSDCALLLGFLVLLCEVAGVAAPLPFLPLAGMVEVLGNEYFNPMTPNDKSAKMLSAKILVATT